jgi:GT2 family glycosyltransferase
LQASIIITSYNRREALIETLEALSRQSVPADQYEIIVVDDGSTDDTYTAVTELSLPCSIKCFRHPENRGISAGRNLAIANAAGHYLILVSDDLLVPEEFIAKHIESLKRFSGSWIVGGFQQLDSLTESSFGRYLDKMEKHYEELRKASPVAAEIWEMTLPTARNLSLPRADLDRTGLFDPQFRSSCEDQDLAHRAREVGIRFLYDASITCLHNDQAGDLKRCCRQQQRFAEQTVAFCDKYPTIHGDSQLSRVNGLISSRDSLAAIAKKLGKLFLSRTLPTKSLEAMITFSEWLGLPDVVLFRMYRMLIGLYIFRGWRDGLRLRTKGAVSSVQSLSYHPHV